MTNPYQTPESGFSQADTPSSQESELANRGTRFLAALVDGLVGIIVAIPLWIGTGAWESLIHGQMLPIPMVIGIVVYGYVAFVLVHYYYLNKNGQTIGKKLLNIRIVGVDDHKINAVPILLKRYLPMILIPQIPILGSIFSLIDLLFIFRKDRRCVHDLIAGTKVMKCPVA
jgi:uncharacterized RDD family membrane protein YckC